MSKMQFLHSKQLVLIQNEHEEAKYDLLQHQISIQDSRILQTNSKCSIEPQA